MRNLVFVMGALLLVGLTSCNNQRIPTFAADADEYTNSINMKFKKIQPGTFSMGSPRDVPLYENDENQHQVQITKPYFIGVYEVTQKQYRQVMGDNPSYHQEGGNGEVKVEGLDTNDFPVEQVSFLDAVEFCKRLNQLEKGAKFSYRLPTEAEWEYACRAGTTTYYHFGDSCKGLEANCRGTVSYPPIADAADAKVEGKHLGRPTNIGSYQPNAFGLYDMSGNAWEWVADLYDGNYGMSKDDNGKAIVPELTIDPKGPQLPEGATDKEEEEFYAKHVKRIIRGGGFGHPPNAVRSANRKNAIPNEISSGIGFRLVLVPNDAG